ncbi:hypothetical protein ACK1CN_20315 [Vibrio coralliilyticus]|uniref:hypothetical protein n=1 Tax=Vibrio coralliilyticus TaxID=190893 RepID=UPI00391726E6
MTNNWFSSTHDIALKARTSTTTVTLHGPVLPEILTTKVFESWFSVVSTEATLASGRVRQQKQNGSKESTSL